MPLFSNESKPARVARRLRKAGSVPSPAPPPASKPTRWDPTQTSALYTWCVQNGVDTRPQYLWPVLHSAHAARALDIPAITVLEFGVAGGNGLIALERAAAAAGDLSATDVHVVGFDSGSGMPTPKDPRDAPWLIEPEYFAMDEAALRARLTSAELVIGDVAETVPAWTRGEHPPIGFISFDLDYYSSTMSAFGVLDSEPDGLLPRIPCYFDDLFGFAWSDFTGERAAIDEYNAANERRKIAKIHGLRFELAPEEFTREWHEKLYVFHAFDHPRYGDSEGRIDERWCDAHRLQPE